MISVRHENQSVLQRRGNNVPKHCSIALFLRQDDVTCRRLAQRNYSRAVNFGWSAQSAAGDLLLGGTFHYDIEPYRQQRYVTSSLQGVACVDERTWRESSVRNVC